MLSLHVLKYWTIDDLKKLSTNIKLPVRYNWFNYYDVVLLRNTDFHYGLCMSNTYVHIKTCAC